MKNCFEISNNNDTVQPAVQSAQHFVEPAVETARNIVEPAVETARHIVEPMVQTAVAAKDYGLEKVEELVKGKKPDTTTDGENHLCERHSKKE